MILYDLIKLNVELRDDLYVIFNKDKILNILN